MSNAHLVVLGEPGVGKSSLIQALGGEILGRGMLLVRPLTKTVDGAIVSYQVVNQHGKESILESSDASTAILSHHPQFTLLAFDLTRQETFAAIISKWALVDHAQCKQQVVLVGCKCDAIADESFLLATEAQAYADSEFNGYFETSTVAPSPGLDQLRTLLFSKTVKAEVATEIPSKQLEPPVMAETIHERQIWLDDMEQRADIKPCNIAAARIFSYGRAKAKQIDQVQSQHCPSFVTRLYARQRRQQDQCDAKRKAPIVLFNSDGSLRQFSFMQDTQASIHRSEATKKWQANVENELEEAANAPKISPKAKGKKSPKRALKSQKAEPPLIRLVLESSCSPGNAPSNATLDLEEAPRSEQVEPRKETDEMDIMTVDLTLQASCHEDEGITQQPLKVESTDEITFDATAESIPHDAEALDLLLSESVASAALVQDPTSPLDQVEDDDVTFNDDDILGALDAFQLSI
ncbi:hypothetical protein AC1031_015490 [Aphanomyces cochlioides]|nr:hypothetical protein AC1031_015490 [Aphanomyces cochlioides]